MSTVKRQQSSSFPKFDRVIRHQRMLAMATGFVTFAMLFGTFGAVSSLLA